jgi:hypothetical protein
MVLDAKTLWALLVLACLIVTTIAAANIAGWWS